MKSLGCEFESDYELDRYYTRHMVNDEASTWLAMAATLLATTNFFPPYIGQSLDDRSSDCWVSSLVQKIRASSDEFLDPSLHMVTKSMTIAYEVSPLIMSSHRVSFTFMIGLALLKLFTYVGQINFLLTYFVKFTTYYSLIISIFCRIHCLLN